MTERKLLGFGHSHLNAIVKAWNQAGRHDEFAGIEAHFANLSQDKFQPNFETVGLTPSVSKDKGLLESITARIRSDKAAHDFRAAGRVAVLTEALEKRMTHILKREKPDALPAHDRQQGVEHAHTRGKPRPQPTPQRRRGRGGLHGSQHAAERHQ